jgi:hypothetical protein
MSTTLSIGRRNGLLLLVLAVFASSSPIAAASQGDISVAGTGERPQLFFACCNGSLDATNKLLADSDVISSLQNLHAGVAVALDDLSPERAEYVRRLNGLGIPVVAGLSLPGDEGYYMNADNAPQADARFTAFQQWTAQYGLRWSAVGLDIEPDIRQFEELRGHRLQLAGQLMAGYFEFGRVRRAKEAYNALIRRIQAQGYKVYTFQLPLIVAERRAHTTLFERLLGIVDVRGDDESVMIFSGFNRSVGAALIWALGPDAQSITIGCGALNGNALSWDEFSRDLIVASHFSKIVGVYNLEGCSQLGYLSRIEAMDWRESVTISAQSLMSAQRFERIARIGLWVAEFLPLILLAALIALAWTVSLLCVRRRKRRSALQASLDRPAIGP